MTCTSILADLIVRFERRETDALLRLLDDDLQPSSKLWKMWERELTHCGQMLATLRGLMSRERAGLGVAA